MPAEDFRPPDGTAAPIEYSGPLPDDPNSHSYTIKDRIGHTIIARVTIREVDDDTLELTDIVPGNTQDGTPRRGPGDYAVAFCILMAEQTGHDRLTADVSNPYLLRAIRKFVDNRDIRYSVQETGADGQTRRLTLDTNSVDVELWLGEALRGGLLRKIGISFDVETIADNVRREIRRLIFTGKAPRHLPTPDEYSEVLPGTTVSGVSAGTKDKISGIVGELQTTQGQMASAAESAETALDGLSRAFEGSGSPQTETALADATRARELIDEARAQIAASTGDLETYAADL